MSTKLLAFVVLLAGSSASFGADWRAEIGRKLDVLVTQLNDGCSEEVSEARKLYQFGAGEKQLFAALISVEGQHCGNGHIEYLGVYRIGYTRPKDERDHPKETYWLAALAIVGGRGQRMVDFETLKYNNETFTANALAYGEDPMCCPSVPIVLRYRVSFYGLTEVQPNKSLERTHDR